SDLANNHRGSPPRRSPQLTILLPFDPQSWLLRRACRLAFCPFLCPRPPHDAPPEVTHHKAFEIHCLRSLYLRALLFLPYRYLSADAAHHLPDDLASLIPEKQNRPSAALWAALGRG